MHATELKSSKHVIGRHEQHEIHQRIGMHSGAPNG